MTYHKVCRVENDSVSANVSICFGGHILECNVLVSLAVHVAGAVQDAGLHRYDESSECAHVSIDEVACYRTERALMGCRGFRYGIRGSPSVSSS